MAEMTISIPREFALDVVSSGMCHAYPSKEAHLLGLDTEFTQAIFCCSVKFTPGVIDSGKRGGDIVKNGLQLPRVLELMKIHITDSQHSSKRLQVAVQPLPHQFDLMDRSRIEIGIENAPNDLFWLCQPMQTINRLASVTRHKQHLIESFDPTSSILALPHRLAKFILRVDNRKASGDRADRTNGLNPRRDRLVLTRVHSASLHHKKREKCNGRSRGGYNGGPTPFLKRHDALPFYFRGILA